MIPDNIKQQITDRPCDTLFGYELANNKLQVLKDENERLKGLVEKAFKKVQIWKPGRWLDRDWQQFKTDNNL